MVVALTADPQSLASELSGGGAMKEMLSVEDAMRATASNIWAKTPMADYVSSTQPSCVCSGNLPLRDVIFENGLLMGNVTHLIDCITDFSCRKWFSSIVNNLFYCFM